MPRPKLKGPHVAVRLPLGAHQALAKRAAGSGVSLGACAAALLTKELLKDEREAPGAAGGDTCAHNQGVSIVGGGLRVCSVCRARVG